MVERKTKLIIFWSIIILIGVIVLIKTDLIEFGKPFSFFPGKTAVGEVMPGKTAYLEGEELTLKLGDANSFPGAWWSACSLSGYGIWIDGKRYKCGGGNKCAGSEGRAEVHYFRCNIHNRPGRTPCLWSTSGTYTPPWGFSFSSPELESGLVPGEHLVEGWYGAVCYRHYPDLPRYYRGVTNFFSFKINVKPRPCKIDAGQYLAGMDFGPGSVYDTNDLPKFVRLCSSSPTMVVNKRTLEVDPDYTIKTKLENNQKITVSSDKIYKQFWVSSNPLAECAEEGLVYNENANLCLSPGTITYCAVGEWINGACAVKLITQCEKDEDCQIPCPGMEAKCESKDQYTKVCKYSGECEIKEEIVVVQEIVYIKQTFGEFISDWIANIFDKIMKFFGVG